MAKERKYILLSPGAFSTVQSWEVTISWSAHKIQHGNAIDSSKSEADNDNMTTS